jgi:hypothetical protein
MVGDNFSFDVFGGRKCGWMFSWIERKPDSSGEKVDFSTLCLIFGRIFSKKCGCDLEKLWSGLFASVERCMQIASVKESEDIRLPLFPRYM